MSSIRRVSMGIHCSSCVHQVPVIPELVCTSFDFFFMDLSLRMVYFGMVHKDHMSSTDFQALKFLSSRKVRTEAQTTSTGKTRTDQRG
jgi:hypothetical protein